jgi:hypothetical protein
VDGWRQLIWCGAHLLWIVGFLCLVIVVSMAVPGGGPRPSSLIGHWGSPRPDVAFEEPRIELDLQADGSFELRLVTPVPVANPVQMQGRYEIMMGHLVMQLPGRRMVWSIARAGGELLHRTPQGQSVRLRRS